MKNVTKKIMALFTALLMALSVLSGAVPAFAGSTSTPESDEITLVASRTGDVLTVQLQATTAYSIGGYEVLQYGDQVDSKVAYTGYIAGESIGESNTVNNPAYKTTAGETVNYWNSNVSFTTKPGETLLTLKYNITDGFEYDTDYVIGVTIQDWFTADIEDLESIGKTFTVTYNEETYYDVTFESNGSTVSTQSVKKGGSVQEVPTVTRNGYIFKGWSDGTTTYEDADAVKALAITAAATFTAVWEKDVSTSSNTVDLSDVTVKKTVTTSATAPNETYSFAFAYKSLEPTESAGKVDESKIPALGPVTITTTSEGTAALGSVEFPYGGIYTYEVSETAGSTAGMTYATNKYTLKLYVEENEDGDLELSKYFIYDENKDKCDSMEFENIYVPTKTLTVRKIVDGGQTDSSSESPLNDSKKFSYTITLNTPGDTFVTNGVKPSYTTTIDGTTSAAVEVNYGSAITVELGDQDTINFTNIPEGVTYSVVEAGEDYYTGEAVVTGDSTATVTDGTYAADVTVEGTVKADVKVNVTNTYTIDVPNTGIVRHNELIVLAGLLVAALVGGFFVSRKIRDMRG